MTHISPRHEREQRDFALRFTNLSDQLLRDERAILRARIITGVCMVGLTLLGAAAGFLAHDPVACADAVAWVIEPN